MQTFTEFTLRAYLGFWGRIRSRYFVLARLGDLYQSKTRPYKTTEDTEIVGNGRTSAIAFIVSRENVVQYKILRLTTNLASEHLLLQLWFLLQQLVIHQSLLFPWLAILLHHKLVVVNHVDHERRHSEVHSLHNIPEHRSHERRLQFYSNGGGSDVPHHQLLGVNKDSWKRKRNVSQ